MRKLALAGGVVFLEKGSMTQILTATLLCFVAICVNLSLHPDANPLVHAFTTLTLVLLFYTLILGVALLCLEDAADDELLNHLLLWPTLLVYLSFGVCVMRQAGAAALPPPPPLPTLRRRRPSSIRQSDVTFSGGAHNDGHLNSTNSTKTASSLTMTDDGMCDRGEELIVRLHRAESDRTYAVKVNPLYHAKESNISCMTRHADATYRMPNI
ncbi:hypothetical protein CYMTET_18871 [Cymbomonas tetramitiformis]|uniref:Uncharacterized protein n=1 Tax=Cymbomonas tetramitiformis TaxID=36881 RepID=A0AAE0L5T3_9CHLO|nr:hypothetical protein CYMTET_18871 [Cymbomonas tetramitiformis]